MGELEITILHLEMKESDLRDEITKPTDFGRCPTTSELLDLSKSFTELGKVVYSLEVLKKLKKDISFNKGAVPKTVSR